MRSVEHLLNGISASGFISDLHVSKGTMPAKLFPWYNSLYTGY